MIKEFDRKNCATRLFIWVCSVLVWLDSSAEAGGTNQGQASFPISLRLDRQSLASAIFLKCVYSPYEVSASTFRTAPSKSPEQVFLRTLTAIQEENLAECKSLRRIEPAQVAEGLMGLLKAYRTSFDLRPEHVKVLGRMEIGTDTLFIWETHPSGGISPATRPARNCFTFEHSNAGGIYWRDGQSNLLGALIRSSLQTSVSSSDFQRGIALRKARHEYSIPATTNGISAALQFNGRVYGVPLLAEEVDPNDEVLNFYRDAFQLFQKGDLEAFAQKYTEESRKKFLGWLGSKRPEEVAAFSSDTLEGRRFISFVIDANPFYIVFFRSNLDLTSGEAHRHDYLWRDPKDGTLKLTNFYFQSFFDDFLNDPGNFDQPFLIPALAAAQRKARGKSAQPQSTP